MESKFLITQQRLEELLKQDLTHVADREWFFFFFK